MARPTKKNDEIKLKLADSIRSGLTVKDSCEVAGISTSSFNRWRASDPSFNKLIDEATRRGWENAEIFAKYHYRGYKRQITHHLPTLPSDPPLRPSGGLTRQNNARVLHNKTQLYAGLPIRFTRPTERPSDYYVNGNNWRVERIDNRGIRHSMGIETYTRKRFEPNSDETLFGNAIAYWL